MFFCLKKSQKGFTYVEVMMTVAFLAITLIPMMIMFWSGTRFVNVTRERNNAAHYAEEKLEAIRDMSYDNITMGNLPDESKTASGIVFTRHTDVETAPAGFTGEGASDMKKIMVTISWNSELGGSRNLSVHTYRTKKLEEHP